MYTHVDTRVHEYAYGEKSEKNIAVVTFNWIRHVYVVYVTL